MKFFIVLFLSLIFFTTCSHAPKELASGAYRTPSSPDEGGEELPFLPCRLWSPDSNSFCLQQDFDDKGEERRKDRVGPYEQVKGQKEEILRYLELGETFYPELKKINQQIRTRLEKIKIIKQPREKRFLDAEGEEALLSDNEETLRKDYKRSFTRLLESRVSYNEWHLVDRANIDYSLALPTALHTLAYLYSEVEGGVIDTFFYPNHFVHLVTFLLYSDFEKTNILNARDNYGSLWGFQIYDHSLAELLENRLNKINNYRANVFETILDRKTVIASKNDLLSEDDNLCLSLVEKTKERINSRGESDLSGKNIFSSWSISDFKNICQKRSRVRAFHKKEMLYREFKLFIKQVPKLERISRHYAQIIGFLNNELNASTFRCILREAANMNAAQSKKYGLDYEQSSYCKRLNVVQLFNNFLPKQKKNEISFYSKIFFQKAFQDDLLDPFLSANFIVEHTEKQFIEQCLVLADEITREVENYCRKMFKDYVAKSSTSARGQENLLGQLMGENTDNLSYLNLILSMAKDQKQTLKILSDEEFNDIERNYLQGLKGFSFEVKYLALEKMKNLLYQKMFPEEEKACLPLQIKEGKENYLLNIFVKDPAFISSKSEFTELRNRFFDIVAKQEKRFYQKNSLNLKVFTEDLIGPNKYKEFKKSFEQCFSLATRKKILSVESIPAEIGDETTIGFKDRPLRKLVFQLFGHNEVIKMFINDPLEVASKCSDDAKRIITRELRGSERLLEQFRHLVRRPPFSVEYKDLPLYDDFTLFVLSTRFANDLLYRQMNYFFGESFMDELDQHLNFYLPKTERNNLFYHCTIKN
jgi:hypothetical protein